MPLKATMTASTDTDRASETMSSPVEDEAQTLKQKGNKAFGEHDWPTAIDFYSRAIEANPNEPSFYCNRAQVSVMMSLPLVWLEEI